MENANHCDQSKVFENILKFMIPSDQLNECVCSGLIHLVDFTNSHIQQCVKEDTP